MKKPTVEQQIIQGLEAFAGAVEKGEELTKRFTCHTVVLDLQPSAYNPELVKQTRATLGVSQVLFSQFLGVSPSTVRAWEHGEKMPQPIACRFMDEIRSDPERWRTRLTKFLRPKVAS